MSRSHCLAPMAFVKSSAPMTTFGDAICAEQFCVGCTSFRSFGSLRSARWKRREITPTAARSDHSLSRGALRVIITIQLKMPSGRSHRRFSLSCARLFWLFSQTRFGERACIWRRLATSTGDEILFADAILSMRYRLQRGLGYIARDYLALSSR